MRNKILPLLIVVLSVFMCVFVGMTNHAQADFLLGDYEGGLWSYSSADDTSTYIGNMGVVMTDIAMDPFSKMLYGITFDSLYSINPYTASSAFIGPLPGSDFTGATFLTIPIGPTVANSSAAESTLIISSTSGLLAAIDTADAGLIGSEYMGWGSSGDLAWDAENYTLYMSSFGPTNGVAPLFNGGDYLIAYEFFNGGPSLVGGIGFPEVYGLDFMKGSLYGFTGTEMLTLQINTMTGAGTPIAFNGVGTWGATAIPEPSTLLLLGTGLLGVVGIARRRKG